MEPKSRLILGAVLALSLAGRARAETGVSDDEIVLGSCAPLDGIAKTVGTQHLYGAKAYLNYVNARGGVHGRKIRLISDDDGFDPDKAIQCFNGLVSKGIFAGAFFVGSPASAKYHQMGELRKIPLVGFVSGAQFLYEPVKHHVFAVRASFRDDTKGLIDSLWKESGVRKVGVIYQNDPMGVGIADGAKQALKAHETSPAGILSFSLSEFEKGSGGVDAMIDAIRAEGAEALIIGALGTPSGAIIKRAREKGWNPVFMVVARDPSIFASGGSAVDGTIVSLEVPHPSQKDLPTVALFNERMTADFPGARLEALAMEGFIEGVVLVEGLKRAGKDLTRESFIAALESMRDVDIGLGPHYRVHYSPEDHKAFDGVYAYMIIRGGKMVPFDAWKSLKKAK